MSEWVKLSGIETLYNDERKIHQGDITILTMYILNNGTSE